MAGWELRRKVESNSNEYDRYVDPVGGSAVLYGHADRREFEVYINGRRFDVPWPDTSGVYAGDSGRPVDFRVRFEVGHWYLYVFVYSGGSNRSEWLKVIV